MATKEPSRRMQRIDQQLQQHIAAIIASDLELPRGTLTTVVAVRTSKDLSVATVDISVLPKGATERVLKVLENTRDVFAEGLSSRMPIRRLPHLRWRLNTSLDYVDHMEQVINKLDTPTP